MSTFKVWDLPTRLFHWLLVASVLIAIVTAEEDGILYTVHALSGVVAGALVAFRVVWGFVGNSHARFTDFVRGVGALKAYSRALMRLSPPHFAGHNPLGGWMVLVLLAVVLATAATGALTGGIAGPGVAEAVEEVHETLGSLIQFLVVVHVAGVLLDWLMTGENLVAAMWHGRKTVHGTAHGGDASDARGGASWLALAVAVPVAALAIYVLTLLPLAGAP